MSDHGIVSWLFIFHFVECTHTHTRTTFRWNITTKVIERKKALALDY